MAFWTMPADALSATATVWPMANLAVDHLVSRSPRSVDDVRFDLRTNAARYRQAAVKLGLSASEYREVLDAFRDGRVDFVPLPHRVNGMSGLHHAKVYVLSHVVVPTGTLGWRVRLADGTAVFVLQECGNLATVSAVGSVSLVRGTEMESHRRLVQMHVRADQRGAHAAVARKSAVLAEIFSHGRLYVAAAGALERIGATVTVSHGGMGLFATNGTSRLALSVGQKTFMLNQQSRHLGFAPLLHNHQMFVAKSGLAEVLSSFEASPNAQALHGNAGKVPVSVMPIASSPETSSVGSAATGALGTIALSPIGATEEHPKANSDGTLIATSIGSHGSGNHGFLQAAISDPHNFNEFSNGQHCPESYVLSGAFVLNHSKFAVKFDYREDVYVTNDSVTGAFGNQYTRFATIDGGVAQTPVFQARQTSLDTRVLYEVTNPQIFVGAGYLHTSNNYGYPQLSGVGVGVEKLPDFRSGVSFYGSSFYYPSASGTYTVPNGLSPNAGVAFTQQYAILKYDAGLAVVIPHSPVYVYGGFSGDAYTARQNAPVNQSHAGPYAGLGAKL